MESPTVAADAISRKRDVDGILESGALGDTGPFSLQCDDGFED